MKSRVTTAVVGLLYLSVVLFFGIVHHHHHDEGQCDHHDECAACAWQLNAITDVPCGVPLVFGPVLETPQEVFDFNSYIAPSFSFSLSRAPPAASA